MTASNWVAVAVVDAVVELVPLLLDGGFVIACCCCRRWTQLMCLRSPWAVLQDFLQKEQGNDWAGLLVAELLLLDEAVAGWTAELSMLVVDGGGRTGLTRAAVGLCRDGRLEEADGRLLLDLLELGAAVAADGPAEVASARRKFRFSIACWRE